MDAFNAATLGQGLISQRRLMFLAFTFIVIVAIILVSPDTRTALLIVAALLAAATAYAATRPDSTPAATDGRREGYAPLPGAPPPYPAGVLGTKRAANEDRYPGSIEVDDYDTEAEYGHRDRMDGDNEDMPYGNPYNRSRISRPEGAGVEIDDEANSAEMDADELNTYHVAARNDPERVAAGTINLRKNITPYLEEECEEAQNREWWGVHEM